MLFNSKPNRDIWMFCAANGIGQSDWINSFAGIFERDPEESWFAVPQTIGPEITPEEFSVINRDYIHDISLLRRECRICFGMGLAMTVHGPLIFNDVPGDYKLSPCMCRR